MVRKRLHTTIEEELIFKLKVQAALESKNFNDLLEEAIMMLLNDRNIKIKN